MQDLLDEIAALKAQHNATILAHYYQEGEIQEIADFAGDSLNLARAATKVQTSTIVFCGVHFMAETAKILNPEKRVLLPDLQAGCSLAESCPADKLGRYQEMLRINGRKFQTVTYINSTAAVKALSDWVVTSGNAEAIIRRVPADYEILFVPDRHLGQYLQEITGRKMILWDGACMVHEIFSVGDLLALKRKMPGAVTLAHPECPANIREHSEFVGGTEAMVKHVAGYAAADRFPRRHGSEHDVAAAEGVPAAPLPPRARHHLRLQQVPAHGPQHARKSARLPAVRQAGDRVAAGVRPGARSAAAEPAEMNQTTEHTERHGRKTM